MWPSFFGSFPFAVQNQGQSSVKQKTGFRRLLPECTWWPRTFRLLPVWLLSYWLIDVEFRASVFLIILHCRQCKMKSRKNWSAVHSSFPITRQEPNSSHAEDAEEIFASGWPDLDRRNPIAFWKKTFKKVAFRDIPKSNGWISIRTSEMLAEHIIFWYWRGPSGLCADGFW